MYFKLLLFIFVLFSMLNNSNSAGLIASEKDFPSLIPKPNKMVIKDGYFNFSKTTNIFFNESTIFHGDYLSQQIQDMIGIKPSITKFLNEDVNNCIILKLAEIQNESNDEAYYLYVQNNKIIITAQKEIGLFRGIQTLLQLFPTPSQSKSQNKIFQIPCCEIQDRPRFGWRGLNLDCGRHFMTKDFIKRYIDILAHFKFNIFHWHLTEDQGWRIEIKKYPKLTEIGAWRKEADGSPYGGFYTQENIKEIVTYAKSRFITIVPEIEMPGHCQASLAAYPENSCTGGPFEVGTQWGVMKDVYCAGNDSTFEFLENVLDEVTQLFPGEYIHIGGDEVPKDRWKECPKCQKRIKTELLKDERELQSYFIKRISGFLSKKGKKIIGWDEILEGGLSPNATVQSWQSFNGAVDAAKQGHYSICSPASHTYLNTDADNLDIRACYSFEPIPTGLTRDEEKYILGSEANLWTEQAPQETVDSKLFPRILALSEVFWTDKLNKNYDAFYSRLQRHYDKLISRGIQFGRESKAISYSTIFDKKKNEFTISLKAGQNDLEIYYTTDGTEPKLTSNLYTKPISINSNTLIKASASKKKQFIGNAVKLAFTLHKALNSKLTIKNLYSERYTAGGLESLVDGVRGTINFRDGQWQGYHEVDFSAIIDMGAMKEISKVTLGCLQNSSSWIFLPNYVEVEVSGDNINYTKIGKIINDKPQNITDAIIKDFSISFNKTNVRYIKVKAENVGKCPAWHQGAGDQAWLFVDEIIVE